MIKEYRKTAHIHAMKWDGSVNNSLDIVAWAAEYGVEIEWIREYSPLFSKLLIPTLEGPMFASVGDFIAKGVNNEFWAIKPDIMAKTYEEVKSMIPYNDQCQYCGTNFVGTGPTVDDAHNDCRSKIVDHEKTCEKKP